MSSSANRLLVVTLALVLGAWLPARGTSSDWTEYRNARFGFSLCHPADLAAGPDPANGDGREFHSADGKFSVAAMGGFLNPESGDSFERRWQEELDGLGSTVTYKKKAASWYVVSGAASDGTEYYHKLFVKGRNWVAVHITYPHAERARFDPWVERIAARFVPFCPGDYDRAQ